MRMIKLMLLIASTILLSQCTKATDLPLQRANSALMSPYKMPALSYLALAKHEEGNEQQTLMIKAAGRLIEDGQWQHGLPILLQQNHLVADLASEKQLLLAKVNAIRERPQAAITQLSLLSDITHLPLYYQIQFHELLALAYQSTGNATESVTERIKLDQLLVDDLSKAKNRRVLWLTLTTLPSVELSTLEVESPDESPLQGWVRLAQIARRSYEDPRALLADIQQWQFAYPQHSGRFMLSDSIEQIGSHVVPLPKQIALLLPLTGSLSGPGHAILDGFMFVAKQRHALNVRTYDTNGVDVGVLYQQAINEGADYVVGPLSKADVTVVAGMNHPVPTLLLNDVEGSLKAGAYQFGMSPRQEAVQVAIKARKKGYVQALVIAPTGVWGDEIAQAFRHQWQKDGGRISDTLRYQSSDNMNIILRDFLHISESEARKEQLKRLLGRHIESTPRRRQDVDMIFLLAYPSKARQIMPLLKYYYAGDVPVYATSSVYGGSPNTMKDRDLEGVIFCDMPWVFDHQMGNKHWPEQLNSYNRLYAFGLDSYALVMQLNQLLLFLAVGVNDNTGVLYLNHAQQIVRMLAWGQVKQGLAQKISGDVLTS